MVHMSTLRCHYDPLRVQLHHLYPKCSQTDPNRTLFLTVYCAPNLYVLFSINGAITEVQRTFAKGTDTTPYHDRPWLLDLLLVTVWMILFFFGPEHTASIPPKKYLKYWFIWPQYTFSMCDGPSQMPPSPEKSTALLDTVNIGLPFGTVQF